MLNLFAENIVSTKQGGEIADGNYIAPIKNFPQRNEAKYHFSNRKTAALFENHFGCALKS